MGQLAGAGLVERTRKKDTRFLKTIKGVDKKKLKGKKVEGVIMNEKRMRA